MPIEPSPAVLRAGDILGQLIQQPAAALSVSELARRVGAPRATCDAILRALSVHRLVTRREDDLRYELGPGGIALGEAARVANPWLAAARIEAERLARELGACVCVCVHDGRSARVVESFDFGPLFAVRARVGLEIPLVPPFGAVFVAWKKEDAEAWIARADEHLEADEQDRYRRALTAVRNRGYSVSIATPRDVDPGRVSALGVPLESDQERDELMQQVMHSDYLPVALDAQRSVRVGQISAPVFDRAGSVAASLLLPGPEREVGAVELRVLAGRLMEAATRATSLAGGREPGVA